MFVLVLASLVEAGLEFFSECTAVVATAGDTVTADSVFNHIGLIDSGRQQH